MQLLLSIIIPHYNIPLFLDKALNSIPSRKDIEVILVDDNSDQNKLELQNVVNSYIHPNFVYLKNTTFNKGAGACRNIGLNRAKGKWVLFLDSDDVLNENFEAIFDKYKASNYDTIFFPPLSYEIDYKTISDRHIDYDNILKNPSNDLLLRYRYSIPVSRFFKRVFLNNNQIRFEEIIASNDIFFTTLVGFYMRDYLVADEIFYVIIKRQGSLTQNLSKKVFRSRLNAFLNKQYFLKHNLRKRDFKLIRSSGHAYFWLALRSGFGFKEFFYITSEFRKHKQRIISWNLINPLSFLKLLKLINKFKKDKNYKTKK